MRCPGSPLWGEQGPAARMRQGHHHARHHGGQDGRLGAARPSHGRVPTRPGDDGPARPLRRPDRPRTRDRPSRGRSPRALRRASARSAIAPPSSARSRHPARTVLGHPLHHLSDGCPEGRSDPRGARVARRRRTGSDHFLPPARSSSDSGLPRPRPLPTTPARARRPSRRSSDRVAGRVRPRAEPAWSARHTRRPRTPGPAPPATAVAVSSGARRDPSGRCRAHPSPAPRRALPPAGEAPARRTSHSESAVRTPSVTVPSTANNTSHN
jgi:hypothetical protein